MVPPGPCTFVGLAYIGCDGSFECRAWIAGDVWTTTQVQGAPQLCGMALPASASQLRHRL